MNIRTFDSVCIWSENPDSLATFYQDVLGLKLDRKLDLVDDYGYEFTVGETLVFIGKHSEVKGTSKDPFRIMPGFKVDSVKAVFDEISPKGVRFIREPSISPEGTYYAATIEDPEGNILQFFSDKP